ncbi:uncharacterized protein SPPG_05709 [Spizellomyces punctatus DAOM BR117]|uniref:Uncharacterized protein n=1 Tax=Spizellomyces punctatus (strain DAOM BR117) TaxID=645134 RepID=A0A0L0HFA5_SPIPD|nr:uncharacterized protein SPPG_05709 [Spizellomyces punctatus DAOM BR117]KNC99473.1 hypothetical protein SPPG_05709 [Spizellomyces punctatus DAOM BR117]|eukprot:XP_016607513.1 hypothetical protein SPPG_05709 [Spizellomyces punctatus DAOM BR117]
MDKPAVRLPTDATHITIVLYSDEAVKDDEYYMREVLQLPFPCLWKVTACPVRGGRTRVTIVLRPEDKALSDILDHLRIISDGQYEVNNFIIHSKSGRRLGLEECCSSSLDLENTLRCLGIIVLDAPPNYADLVQEALEGNIVFMIFGLMTFTVWRWIPITAGLRFAFLPSISMETS